MQRMCIKNVAATSISEIHRRRSNWPRENEVKEEEEEKRME